MDQVKEVRVYREYANGREFDRIKVVIGDLHLRADVKDARDVRLAQRLALDHDAPFFCDPRVSEETKRAMQERQEANYQHIKMLKVSAAEDAVIADLKRMGLA